MNDKPMFVWDNGTALCTLTHTEDFAYNFVQLYLNKKAFNEDINFVGDQVYSWQEMLETLYELLDKDKKILFQFQLKKLLEFCLVTRNFLSEIGRLMLYLIIQN